MIALDTNILIYAHRGETEIHGAAASRLAALAEGVERWALPVFCVAELLRVVPHYRVFNPPSSIQQAVAFLKDVFAAPNCDVVRPGPEFLEVLVAAARKTNACGNRILDAQIAALCREHGAGTILTDDRDFFRFEPLQMRCLQ